MIKWIFIIWLASIYVIKSFFKIRSVFNIYLLLVLSFLFACKTKPKNQSNFSLENSNQNKRVLVTKQSDSIIEKTDTLSNNQIASAYFSKALYVNNIYEAWGERKDLKKIVKNADSINKQGYECGYFLEDNHEIWYYLKNEIEVSNTDYVFRTIDFSFSNITVRYGKTIFSKNYTLLAFKKDFPLSFKDNQNEDNKEKVLTISVPIHPKSDGMYIFEFKDGRLIKLHSFFPC